MKQVQLQTLQFQTASLNDSLDNFSENVASCSSNWKFMKTTFFSYANEV